MSNIHPDWQSEEDVPVPVTVKDEENASVQISRRPAAIVGMLLVVGIGFSFFRGVENLTGQLSGNTQTIRITENGFEPDRLEVEHGQTITWMNEQDVPHIVESGTLCSDTGFCLMTNTLFKGDSDNFTITPDMPSGSYQYTSTIVDGVSGEIVIVTDVADDFVDISEILGNDFFGESVATTTPPPSGFDSQDFSTAPARNPSGLPTNPYAIGNERIHPFDSSGDPIPEAFGDEPTNTQQNAAAANAIREGRGPIRQPETGAGVWAVILGSTAGLYWVTRNSFAKTL
jgi:plastocyanin